MKFIRYVLKCIIGCFDASVGTASNITEKEGTHGCLALLAIFSIFFTFLYLLDNKTKISYKFNIPIAIGLTIVVILIIIGLSILVENIFNL